METDSVGAALVAALQAYLKIKKRGNGETLLPHVCNMAPQMVVCADSNRQLKRISQQPTPAPPRRGRAL